VPVSAPSRPAATPRPRPVAARVAASPTPEAAAHTRRALSLLRPTPETAPQRHDLLVALGRRPAAQRAPAVGAGGRRLGDRAWRRETGDAGASRRRPASGAASRCGTGGRTASSTTALVALLQDLADRAGDEHPALQPGLLGTLGVELPTATTAPPACSTPNAPVALARTLDDPALLGRTLNNLSLAAWGSAEQVERRLSASDEAIALSGRGLPARTEFFARLHRGPLRLHLGDVDGFCADLAAATRLSATLTGPEVRPHVLYQSVGLSMLRGAWEEAEEQAVSANELYRAPACGARSAAGRCTPSPSAGARAGSPTSSTCSSTRPTWACRSCGPSPSWPLRRRVTSRRRAGCSAGWPTELPCDWTTDALLVARAWPPGA
jgi:hypothetical protein